MKVIKLFSLLLIMFRMGIIISLPHVGQASCNPTASTSYPHSATTSAQPPGKLALTKTSITAETHRSHNYPSNLSASLDASVHQVG